MAGSGSNDFFLQFGSDAEPFSRQLAADLDPGIGKINALREALAAYEEQATKSKSGSSPLGLTFEGLDQAAARIERATADFGKQFGSQINQLTSKVEGLAEILRSASRVASRPSGPVRQPASARVTGVAAGVPAGQSRGYSEGFTPEQLAIMERQRQNRVAGATANATRVTPAEQAAAGKQKQAAEQNAQASKLAADANSATAKQITATSRALDGLNERLRSLVDTAKGLSSATPVKAADATAANADAVLQIGNTSANPIPVVVVGGEAQAVAGHPPAHAPAHQGHIPRATTATQTAKAQEEVAAAAEVANAPNSRRNPARVSGNDSVSPGEYFLLPGDNPKQPRRAYGIRPGETAGQYTERVDAVRGREQGYLSGAPRLSDYDQEQLRRANERYGPFPEPKARIEPGALGKSAQNQETVNARALPKDVANLLRRRDLFAAETGDQAHSFVLDELRRDPHLTQDGLAPETKSALRQVDEAILALQNRSQAARLFNSQGTPDLDDLRQGATRRRYMADTGAAAAEEYGQRRYVQSQLNAVQGEGLRDRESGRLVVPGHESTFNSDVWLGDINAGRRAYEESGAARHDDVANAGARYRSAQAMAERLANLRPSEDVANALDDNGQRVSLETLRGQLGQFMSPYLQGELSPQIRRAQAGVRRNNPSSVERYRQQLAELTAHRASLAPVTQGTFDEQLASLREVSQRYAAIRGDALTSRVVDTGRPEDAKAEVAELTEQVAALETEKEKLAEREKSTSRRRQSRTQSSSKSEQAGRAEAGGTRITRGQSINLRTGQVEDEPEHDWDSYDSSDIHQRQRAWEEDAATVNSARSRKPHAGGGGNTPPPPRPPAPPAAPEPEPEPEPNRPVTPLGLLGGELSDAARNRLANLSPETQQSLLAARQQLAAGNLSREEQQRVIQDAAAAAHGDQGFTRPNRDLWGIGGRANALWDILGIQRQGSGAALSGLYTAGRTQAATSAAAGYRRPDETTGSGTGGAAGARGEAELAGASERAARMEQVLAESSGKVREARLAEIIAEENLARVRANSEATTGQVARAEMQLSSAARNSADAEEQAAAEANKSRYAQLTGRRTGATFGQDLVRHGSLALENTIGYSLVFTGFEKLREVVQTGIETQAVFVRLQASLDANGIAAGNLQTKLVQISATTATPLEQVTEAAAELSGTLKNASDIEFGTKIASQLANISQGALTAQEAAVGLRDVFTAFGNDWAKSGMTVQQGLRATGDQIAHLSQLTGVSVKDITEGSTQIAAEASEFGLSQRQAETLAAYISKGTGESGEESAAQASRMMATLYNGKTQNVLEETRTGTNPNGSARMLATQRQFEQGDIGGVLSEIAQNWDKLSPRQRQTISAQMGTGIQARAFSAFVGGGKAASAEMNGTANDNNALNKQNQSYLQTVAGMIKQLDEDFQNLGNTLQRLGAFDAIGILAKSMDELLKTFNAVFGSIASFMNSNPITQGLMHWSTVILEAAAAWKLLGSAATGALVKAGVLRNIQPTNAAEIEAASAAGMRAPRPVYPFGSVMGAAGTRVSGAFGGGISGFRNGVVNRGQATRSYVNDVRAGNYADLTPAGLQVRGKVAAAQSVQAKAIEAETKAETSATEAADRVTVARAAEREAADRLTAAEERGGVEEDELNGLRAAQIQAQEAYNLATREATAAQEALATASAAAATATEELAAATQAQVDVRAAGFMGGFSGSRFGMMASMGSLLLAGPVGSAISGGESPGGGMRGFAGSTASGIMYGAGIGGMIGGAPGAAVGAVGGTIYGAGKALLDAKKAEDNQPSSQSDQEYIDLVNQLYNAPGGSKAVAGANQRLGYKAPTAAGKNIGIDQLTKLGSVDDVNQWVQAEQDYIKKHADAIATAGGNNAAGQKEIQASIKTLKDNLNKDAQRRIAELEGLDDIDNLNATQLQAMNSLAGTAGSLNMETISSQGAALKTLLNQAGLPTSGQAYQDLQTALGQGSLINTVGINNKGRIGQYSADGKWHQASARVTAGIGPTEGSHLPQLGNGPTSSKDRLFALQQVYQQGITVAQSKLDTNNGVGLSPEDRAAYNQMLTQDMTAYQQVTQQMHQAPITRAQGRASILASLGGTPDVAAAMGLGTGGDQAAVASLASAKRKLRDYNSTLEQTDPQYWQNLQQIQQNKLTIAQLQNQPAINKLMVAAAGATDATTQANLKYEQAVKQLRIDQAGGASSAQMGQDRSGIAAAGVGQRQTQESVTEATAQAQMAGVQNSVTKAQMQYRDALRLEAVYAQGGTLQDKANYENAIGQAAQAQISIRDAIESQTQAAYDATAAWQKFNGDQMGALYTGLEKAQQAYADAVSRFGADSQQAKSASAQIAQARTDIRNQLQQNALAIHDAKAALDTMHGDAVGAAAQQLAKAEQAYRQAVTDYGKDSSQASQALAGVDQARQAFWQAQVDQVNSYLDLEIAQLNARGRGGDAQKAAQDAVQKVRNQIQSYLHHGGEKGTKEYRDLMSQLAGAQRTAFDTALQAQLDTLDFQRETYKITSSQEVQSLQQILNNKQLTLKEQRDITLKIKNLQDSIRQELTQGGLNIPSDIKLPTAYEVRRSLGAGFNGGGATVANTTNNNNQRVTIHNNVPNERVAKQIAQMVMSEIHKNTNRAVRASSSTPRVVPTR